MTRGDEPDGQQGGPQMPSARERGLLQQIQGMSLERADLLDALNQQHAGLEEQSKVIEKQGDVITSLQTQLATAQAMKAGKKK